MKFLKTAMAAVLSFGFVFSTAACEESGGESGGGSTNAENAFSFSVTADIEYDVSMLDEEGLDGSESALDLELDMDVSFTGETLNAKLDVSSSLFETNLGVEELNVYLVDGDVYLKNPMEENSWMCMYSGLDDQLEALLTQQGITEETISTAIDMVLEELALVGLTPALINEEIYNAFEQYAKVENGYFVFTADAKDTVNGVIDYVASLTSSTTLRQVLDDALALVSDEITCETVLTEFAGLDLGSKTVGDIYDYANDLLTTETGMSIQECYEMIISNEYVQMILMEEFTAEEIAEMTSFDIEMLLAEVKDETIDELIATIMEEEGETPQTVEELIDFAVDALDAYTLGDIDPEIEAVFDMVGTFEVSALYTKSGVKYNAEKNITDMFTESKIDFDGTVIMEEYDDTTTYVEPVEISVYVNEKIAVNNIKDSATKIALPKGAKIVYTCSECGNECSKKDYRKDYGMYLCDDCYEMYAEWYY